MIAFERFKAPFFALSAGLALAALPGCLVGTVDDATTKQAIKGVDVTATGDCKGSGCTSATTGHEKSDDDGNYVFDHYGDHNGSDDIQTVTPAANRNAIGLVFSKSGYTSIHALHQPSYKEYTTDAGKSYEYTDVQKIFLCRTGSVDTDHDGVCDAAEDSYGTDPNDTDTDNDGISDMVELFGADDVDPRYYGASALHKDVFVYVDYYVQPKQEALDDVVAAFAASPLGNPDGKNGINLHIVMGQQIATADQIPDFVELANNDWTKYDVIKNKYFPKHWAKFAHYALFANRQGGDTTSGKSRGIPAHDFIVTLGGWPTRFGTQLEQSGTFMHELGHTLGLKHGGNENTNYKINYLSVMSYTYQTDGLYRDGKDGVLDYSRVQIDAVAENSLNEQKGMAPTGKTTAAELQKYRVKVGNNGLLKGTANGQLDFDNDGKFDTGTVSVDFDGDGKYNTTFKASQNDWNALIYTGAAGGGGAIGYAGLTAPMVMSRASNGNLTVQPPTFASPPARPQLVTPELMEPELTAER